jgi:hypothetical protein
MRDTTRHGGEICPWDAVLWKVDGLNIRLSSPGFWAYMRGGDGQKYSGDATELRLSSEGAVPIEP